MTDEDDDSEETADMLKEIMDKAGVSVAAFGLERFILLVYSYIVTTTLGSSFYGYLSVFTRGNSLARSLTFVSTGNERTIPRLDGVDKSVVTTISYTILFLFWIVITVTTFVFRDQIISLTLLEPRHESTIMLFVIGVLPLYLLYNNVSILRSLRKIRLAMAISGFGVPISILIAAAVAIGVFDNTTTFDIWMIYVTIISAVCLGSFWIVNVAADFSLKPNISDLSIIKDYLKYTGAAVFVTVLGFLQRQSVFVVMALFLSPVSAGLFSLALIIGQICRWPLNGVNQIFPAIATELYENGQKEMLNTLYQKTSLIAAYASGPVVILTSTYYSDILVLFSADYLTNAIILPTVIVGQYVATIMGSVGLLLMMTDNEKESAGVHLLHVIVVLPTIIFLTLEYGIVGLALAYFISLTINNITEVMLLSYLEGLSPFTRRHIYITLLIGAITGIMYLVKTAVPIEMSIVISAVSTVAYLYLGYKILLQSDEQKAVRSIVSY